MLSSLSDDDGFVRCFKVSENMFLCRDGLSNVLQLSRRKKQSIVPPSKLIGKRYRLVCISEIFHALVLYRTSLLKLCLIQSENPIAETVNWSSPFFVDAIKKVNRIQSYRGKDGISTFCSHLGITKAIKSEEIILGATGNHHLSNFIGLVKGCVIDLSKSPCSNHVLDELYDTILHFPCTEWK
jgi:hypothetical protein